VKISRADKYQLIVPKEKDQLLRRWEGCNRLIFNLGLTQRDMAYQLTRKYVSYEYQANELKDLKLEFAYLKEPPAPSLQQTLKHLDTAFSRFFSGLGKYPKYKRKKNPIGIHFPDPKHFEVRKISKNKGLVDLPKIGKLKFWWSKDISGKIRHAVITCHAGKWYISFNCSTEIEDPKIGKLPIALDLGINETVTTSCPIDNKRNHSLPIEKLKKLEAKIAKIQQLLKSRIKYSRSWKKINQRVAKIYHQISSIKQDWIHKLTTKIAKNHGLIFVEDLDIQAMMASASGTKENPGTEVAQKRGLNRSIQRQNWGEITRCLGYKGYWYGEGAWYVPPQNTSITCNSCKHISKDNREKGSIEFYCQRCGYETHADNNAADNILEAGLALIASEQAMPVLRNQPLLRATI
jgi:putative transposase